jgi:hypothetical protein
VAEAVSRESKRIEEEVFKKLKSYVDKALEDVRREIAAGKAEQRTEQQGPPSIAENEWVKLIRKRG